jgi:hypothetical protein
LDIEEPVPLSTPIRALNYLRTEFGPEFLLTLAPVCTALLPHTIPNPAIPLLPYHFSVTSPVPSGKNPATVPTLPHLSGFSYPELMASEAGKEIAWLNTQLYCNWGDASQPAFYDAIISSGWPAEKIVLGVVSSPRNGAGYVQLEKLKEVLRILRSKHGGVDGTAFGGLMCWEYFNCGHGDDSFVGNENWQWVKHVGEVVRSAEVQRPMSGGSGLSPTQQGQGAQGRTGPQMPGSQVQWPGEDLDKLVALGFNRVQAVAALNATDGNVELAAGLLFGG